MEIASYIGMALMALAIAVGWLLVLGAAFVAVVLIAAWIIGELGELLSSNSSPGRR